MGFNEKSYKGHLLMVVAYTVFGLNIPAVKSIIGVAGITGLSVTFYRMAGAAVLFWFASLFVRREKVPPRDIAMMLAASLFCIFLNQTPFIVGVSLTSPIDAAVITTTGPMITMLLAAMFLREPITWLKAGGVLVGAAGALMLVLGGGADGAGQASRAICCVWRVASRSQYI